MINSRVIIETVGYLGSALVVISMLMTSVKKLRIVNSIGSVIFTVYALIIQSYPTALMNLCIVIINIYQLVGLSQKEKHFQLLKVKTEGGVVQYLLEYYQADIVKFFPELSTGLAEGYNCAYLVTCDTTPAGLLLGNEAEDGVIMILLDYATPAYRDASVGKYLYSHLPEYGINKLIFSGRSVGHEKYMKDMGFVKEELGYIKNL